MSGASSLVLRLLAWLRGDGAAFGSFEEAAEALFRFQWDHNAPYRRYCEARGMTAARYRGWESIPALPTDAFKFPDCRPSCFPPECTLRTFLTSGTTREIRGRHDFERLDLYETSIREGWRHLRLPEIAEPWLLSPPPEEAEHSSLVHMFATLAPGAAEERWLIRGGELIRPNLSASGKPVQWFATALALRRFLEAEAPLPLPEGSWIFETGGYKGLTETLDPETFRQRLGEHFGIPPQRILNEYSMTELSSQFYRWPDEEGHRGPPWTRIRVIDPETGRRAAEGEPGYLEILDLANAGSVMAIRTQDLAIARGPSEFTLLGRDPGALPRGCSRSVDDLLSRA